MKLKKRINTWFRNKLGLGKIKERDIKKYGFIKTQTNGKIKTFYKGSFNLKWRKLDSHDIITIRRGKSLRHYGIVESPKELNKVLSRVFDYKLLM